MPLCRLPLHCGLSLLNPPILNEAREPVAPPVERRDPFPLSVLVRILLLLRVAIAGCPAEVAETVPNFASPGDAEPEAEQTRYLRVSPPLGRPAPNARWRREER